MHLDFATFIRRRSGSNTYYMIIPSDYIKSIVYEKGSVPMNVQVKVEVTL